MLSVFLNYSFEESFRFNPQTSSMDAHFLLDVFNLCAVALLVFILIVTKVTKKRRQLQSIKTTGTQTSNIVPNLDDLQDLLRADQPAGSHGDPGTEPTADDQLLQDGVDPAQPERESSCPDRG